ncbi:YidB family protein [Leptothrix discophora]|uniref:YidB family protein n=1 Tax=Leptothrix discophora TaxID=89 RepID=A0ABT9FZP5_LEPDI|nr:YidB family protein [Leptothrix discophora]MDP4299691.1 YidB family protein [Leptothrix discophora]
MGLFDAVAGQLLGAVTNAAGDAGGALGGDAPSGLLEAVGGLLNNPETGGLQGLISSFESQGLGGVVQSWVGTGENLPISPEQIQSVLGNGQLQGIAQSLGLSPEAISGHLASLLPQLVDRLTPTGQVPDALPDMSALGGLLGMLKG